jgi:Uma2 family endonuclease
MNQPAKRKATYEDLAQLPEGVTGEIIAGELYTQPRPATAHILAASHLEIELGAPFGLGRGGPGGWWIFAEPELHLEADVLVPDLAGWRRERMPNVPNQAAFTVAPDWVCEIFSPSTRRKDQMIKLPAYLRHEVKWVWFVDPEARTVQALEARHGGWFILGTYGDVDRARIPPFAAIELDLSTLWPSAE